ncbi:MAG TPA: hypothetical protein VEH49_05595 [Methylomirabilota bacterium]|nr:hypothetical protein [Methylomirabilota bacterium]
MFVEVTCYSGFRGDERPLRFVLAGRRLEVSLVEDRWYSPGAAFFRVLTAEGDRYVLRHDEGQDVWSLEGFRAAGRLETRLAPQEREDPEPIQ